MRYVRIESDYAPGTFLTIVQNDDGDFIFRIRGEGEMRIAMSGGQLHGERLVRLATGLSMAIEAILAEE